MERQTCPRRMDEFGPWERRAGLDLWVARPWGVKPVREFLYWWHNGPVGDAIAWWNNLVWAHWRARGTPMHGWWYFLRMHCLPSDSRGGTQWAWPWQPRVCSFCGGAHPVDVIRLLDEGWETEWSDKGYKAYLQPPGMRAWRERSQGLMRQQHESVEAFYSARDRAYSDLPWSPVPPVKIYLQHFGPESRRKADAASARYRSAHA